MFDLKQFEGETLWVFGGSGKMDAVIKADVVFLHIGKGLERILGLEKAVFPVGAVLLEPHGASTHF
jgi:hypothetical protein